MITRSFEVTNETGLHARPAAELSKLCKSFKSNIALISEDKRINPRSVVSILAGELVKGKSFAVSVEGEDEKACMEAMTDFFAAVKD